MANAVTYKTMDIEYIIAWCEKNGQQKWLKDLVANEVPYEVYPKVQTTTINKNGKEVKVWVADKTKKPVTEMRKISFVDLKYQFCEKFMPEILPKKKVKANMYDLIEAL